MAAAAMAQSVYLTRAQVKQQFGIEFPKDMEVEGIHEITPENMPVVKRVIEAYLRWQEAGARRNQIRAELDAMDTKKLKKDRLHLKHNEMDPTPVKAAQFAEMDSKYAALNQADKVVQEAHAYVSTVHRETGMRCPNIMPPPYLSKEGAAHMIRMVLPHVGGAAAAGGGQIVEGENEKLIFAHEAQDLFGIPFVNHLTVCGVTLLTDKNIPMIKEVIDAYVVARNAEQEYHKLKNELDDFDRASHNIHELQKMHWAPEELEKLAQRDALNKKVIQAAANQANELKFRDDLCIAYGISLKNF